MNTTDNNYEKQITKSMIDWFDQEYGKEFDFKKIEGAIELMLINHSRDVLKKNRGNIKNNKTLCAVEIGTGIKWNDNFDVKICPSNDK